MFLYTFYINLFPSQCEIMKKKFLLFLIINIFTSFLLSINAQSFLLNDNNYLRVYESIYQKNSRNSKKNIDEYYYLNAKKKDPLKSAWINYLYASYYKKNEDFKETFRYAKMVNNYALNYNNQQLIVLSNEQLAWVFYNLNWFSQSEKILKTNFQIIKEIENESLKDILTFKNSYRMAGLIRAKNGKNDSVIHYYQNGLEHIKDYKNMILSDDLASLLDNLGYAYLEEDLDSAMIYFNKSKKFISPYNKVRNAIINTHIAEVEKKRHNNHLAKRLIEDAIPIVKDSEHKYLISYLYKNLAAVNDNLGLAEEEIKATQNFILYKDSLDIKRNLSVDLAINYIQNQTEKEKNKLFMFSMYSIIVILVILSLMLLYQLISQKKHYKKELDLWKKSHDFFRFNTIENSTYLSEQIQLNTRILNAMFQRDINFRDLFNELHKSFEQRLLAKEGSLNRTDLDFCYYLRMGLSTKEIERASGLKPKAIEYRKYKLRKLFNLEPKDDLYDWINKI